MAKELENGKILDAFKTWGKMFYGITALFIPYFIAFAVISLLGWAYGTIYVKFGIEKVIVSFGVIIVYYLGKLLGQLTKLNKHFEKQKNGN
jgi:ribose/xylose/arabinose/galactoside ABC-type transport system permease subunit